MKHFLSVLTVAAFVLMGWCGDGSAIVGRVVKVTDGDTVTVLDSTKTQHKIRLLDIDAPESHQAFGRQSQKHLADMIAGKSVRVTWQQKDMYGRILGTIWGPMPGQKDESAKPALNVNLQMIRDGYAWVYHYSKNREYTAAMEKAKSAKLGLWVDPHAIDPWAYRKEQKEKAKLKKAANPPVHPEATNPSLAK